MQFTNPFTATRLKKTAWVLGISVGIGCFASAMLLPFVPNMNGWQLSWHTLKTDAWGGAPHSEFVLLLVVKVLIVVSAWALLNQLKARLTLSLAGIFLAYAFALMEKILWSDGHTLLLCALIALFVAMYSLPAQEPFHPVLFAINTLILIYVFLIVMSEPIVPSTPP